MWRSPSSKLLPGKTTYVETRGGARRKNPKDPPVKNPADVQLFDMQNDPAESTNLQALRPEIVNQLAVLLNQYISEGRSLAVHIQWRSQAQYSHQNCDVHFHSFSTWSLVTEQVTQDILQFGRRLDDTLRHGGDR